ncbi:hypothetical protein A5635_18970 [Mycobacterium asiaticum]|uniref:Uncharacterized protein n=1 Tax=Mycobacterium asiaticum TaxID=1790 RepID=A0A1A3NN41_MYCAS|nr:hypothetical protein A5635_18970 [Mycobacterium asiaticum]
MVVVTRFAWIGDRAASAACSTLGANAPALISGIGNIGSQVSGFLHGQASVLQAALAALSPIQANLVTTTT